MSISRRCCGGRRWLAFDLVAGAGAGMGFAATEPGLGPVFWFLGFGFWSALAKSLVFTATWNCAETVLIIVPVGAWISCAEGRGVVAVERDNRSGLRRLPENPLPDREGCSSAFRGRRQEHSRAIAFVPDIQTGPWCRRGFETRPYVRLSRPNAICDCLRGAEGGRKDARDGLGYRSGHWRSRLSPVRRAGTTDFI